VLDIAPRFLWVVGPGSVDPATHIFRVTVDGLTRGSTRSTSPGNAIAQWQSRHFAALPPMGACPPCPRGAEMGH